MERGGMYRLGGEERGWKGDGEGSFVPVLAARKEGRGRGSRGMYQPVPVVYILHLFCNNV